DAAHAPAAQWLADRLRRRREKEREKSVEASGPASVLAKLGSWWGLREEVLEAREAMDSLLAESLHLQTDAFSERAGALLAGGATCDPEGKPQGDGNGTGNGNGNGSEARQRPDPHQ